MNDLQARRAKQRRASQGEVKGRSSLSETVAVNKRNFFLMCKSTGKYFQLQALGSCQINRGQPGSALDFMRRHSVVH